MNDPDNHMVLNNDLQDAPELTEKQEAECITDMLNAWIESESFDDITVTYPMFREHWAESMLIGFMIAGSEFIEYKKWANEYVQKAFKEKHGIELSIEQVKGAL